MQLFDQDPIVSEIFKRAHNLYVSVEFALAQQGVHHGLNEQETEQHARRRELLAVEEQANKSKLIENHSEIHFKQQIEKKFNIVVGRKMATEFENTDKVINSVLKIEDAIPGILDILSVRAASVGRIKLMVKSMFWLCEDAIDLVNKPQYRKRADVKVQDPILALNYIGLDNLKIVLPSFIIRHWLPHSTAPFKLMKRKLWSESLGIGLASQALAKPAGIDPFTAYCGGLFSNAGYMAITRSYLSFYDRLIQHELQKAYKAKDKRLHTALTTLQPSDSFLSETLSQYGSTLSAEIMAQMHFERLRFTESFEQLAQETNIRKMTPLAKIITQAKVYCTFKSLQKHHLISGEEAKHLLAFAQINSELFALLQKTDISRLNLNMSQE